MKALALLILVFSFSSQAIIENPYSYVWNEKQGSTEGIKRFFFDLNYDGNPELFVGANSELEQSSGVFHVFETGKKYRYLGEINLDPENIQFQTDSNSGFKIIKTFVKDGDELGKVFSYKYSKGKYKRYAVKRVKQNQLNKEIKTAASIYIQDSGLELSWMP